jgi:hypothetical protein
MKQYLETHAVITSIKCFRTFIVIDLSRTIDHSIVAHRSVHHSWKLDGVTINNFVIKNDTHTLCLQSRSNNSHWIGDNLARYATHDTEAYSINTRKIMQY